MKQYETQALRLACKKIYALTGSCPNDLYSQRVPGVNCDTDCGDGQEIECWIRWFLTMDIKGKQ